jgi:hypothetical protein
MEEIKRRTLVVTRLLNKELTTGYRMTDIETIYLQLRKVLELIALGSLVANVAEYSRQQKKFAQHWHAARILDDLHAVNSNFYPVPGVQVIDEATGKVKSVDSLKKPFLTKADFVTLYEMCGGILHAENPYGQPRDIAVYDEQMRNWLDKTVALLNHHQIQLLDSELMLWVIMHAENDGRVRGFIMQKIPPPNQV